MQSSIKIFLLLAISLLLLARVNAQDINENYAVDTEIAESRVSSTGDFTYEDYGSTENRSEQLIVSNDAPFSLQRKYIVTLIKLNWFAAYAFCEQNGWSLVSIESASEQFQVQNYINYFNLESNDFWTSGNKLADLQNFRWGYNGSKFSYTNWAMGRPDNFMGAQHCVKLQEHFLKWDDDFCENSHHFICQIDTHPTTKYGSTYE
ncbi:C-type lectin 37Db [Bactrocera oleae]|uniref:C-type lectin 37Db n=1 Tax=Bactrocera oleae TaxID=104688 RepID=UPI0006B7C688|nr:galactose-specific lectin nattectin [Bactrocera oleae]